jgi:hypothetical protein
LSDEVCDKLYDEGDLLVHSFSTVYELFLVFDKKREHTESTSLSEATFFLSSEASEASQKGLTSAKPREKVKKKTVDLKSFVHYFMMNENEANFDLLSEKDELLMCRSAEKKKTATREQSVNLIPGVDLSLAVKPHIRDRNAFVLVSSTTESLHASLSSFDLLILFLFLNL